MSWSAVRAWRELLHRIDPSPAVPTLSGAGAQHALAVQLDALTDTALDQVAAMPGKPWSTATVTTARTVSTAAIEWCAVLLGRGTRVVWKHPLGAPGLAPLLADAAAKVRLPLTVTADRAAVDDAELVVAMGSDETITAIRDRARGTVLGFGHRFSVAWVTERAGLAAVADDAALHDGRGCMSPVAVFTPLANADATLAAAMVEAQRRWPVGAVAPAEAAAIRARRALARAVGAVHEGDGWSVHALPVARWSAAALPRSIAVHQVTDVAGFAEAMAPMLPWLSTVGADAKIPAWPAVRVAALGRMQRPPLVRRHDGVDWLKATLQPADR